MFVELHGVYHATGTCYEITRPKLSSQVPRTLWSDVANDMLPERSRYTSEMP